MTLTFDQLQGQIWHGPQFFQFACYSQSLHVYFCIQQAMFYAVNSFSTLLSIEGICVSRTYLVNFRCTPDMDVILDIPTQEWLPIWKTCLLLEKATNHTHLYHHMYITYSTNYFERPYLTRMMCTLGLPSTGVEFVLMQHCVASERYNILQFSYGCFSMK